MNCMNNNMTVFPKELIHKTPATIRLAYEKAKPGIKETGAPGNMNISSILTKIIHDCGRFSERYTSDCLYDIDVIRTLCESKFPIEEAIDEVFALGIRQDGVDHNAYVMSQLYNHSKTNYAGYVNATPYYRRVLAVHVRIAVEPAYEGGQAYPRVTCELRNITHEFLRINEADLDSESKLLHIPYENGNPVPITSK